MLSATAFWMPFGLRYRHVLTKTQSVAQRRVAKVAPLARLAQPQHRQQQKLAYPRWQTSTARTKVCSQTASALFVSGLSRSALILPLAAARL